MSDFHNTTLISTGIVAALPLIAVGHFLCFGWPARREQILSHFSDKAIKHYRETFCPESKFKNKEQFAQHYDRRYSRWLFLFPVLLFATALIGLSYLSASWVWTHDWYSATEGTPKIAIFALAGAYIWVTYDLIIRARQNDVVPSDINRHSLRLLLSLPFGFAISAFASALGGSASLTTGPLAFFVGAFPTDTVLKFMRRTAGISLKLDADIVEDGVKQLTRIDGISVPIAERFIDEGVKTNVQLAYTDPIALTIKSGMDFGFVLMCFGQAMVRTYFNDDQMVAVQKYGLHTGLEIKAINDALESYDEVVKHAAEKNEPPVPPRDLVQARAQEQLENFAKAIALDTSSTRFILDQIAEDPCTWFMWWMWPETETEATEVEIRRSSPDQPCGKKQ